jgi:hypothetical protein
VQSRICTDAPAIFGFHMLRDQDVEQRIQREDA